ncbi:hypothetical protein KBA41_05265 [Candidatus Ozemobacteraceae bacterium]|nr:hypothetical protein [Candidatus Ozemobacteraceae bacterium]
MEQSPKVCSRCQQANFPIAEYCRHCGEPLFEIGSISRAWLPGRLLGHLVDGLVWAVAELRRWWEIGGLTVRIKSLERRRAVLFTEVGSQKETAETQSPGRERLMAISGEIAELKAKDEILRRRSWALTPEILFGAIVIAFIAGILLLQPRTDLVLQTTQAGAPAGMAGSVSRTVEYRLGGFANVTTAAWWNGSLFVGGDGGVAQIDPATGLASAVNGLPAEFYARHLLADDGRLIVAGYGGAFAIDVAGGVTPLYEGTALPVDLMNRVAPTSDGGHLIGTVGHGLLKGRNRLAVVLLGTQGLTPVGFGWLDGELWVAHERGLLKGDGTNFEPVRLQLLDGRAVTALAADRSAIYVGTDNGLAAGFKNGRDWVWTTLSPGEPKVIRDMVMVGDALLVCSEEGLFRYRDGRFEKLSGDLGQRVLAINGEFVATVGPKRILLHGFQGLPTVAAPAAPLANMTPTTPASVALPAAAPVQPIIPSVGTYAPDVPTASTAVPVVLPSTPQVSAPTPPQPQIVSQSPAAVQAASDPVFGMVPLPASLRGPSASCALWDGTRVWIGTTNDGLWFFDNGRWESLNRSNGALGDDQIVALWRLNGKSYLYSWILGIMSLEGGRPSPLLAPAQAAELVSATGSGNGLLLLKKGGWLVRVDIGGKTEPAGRIPEDFFREARFVQTLEDRPLVVTDRGVLEQDQSGRWAITFYPGEPGPDLKATASVAGEGRLYIGLSNGSIFTYAGRSVSKIGSISGRVRGLAWDQNLWITGENTIFQLSSQGGTPVAVGGPFPSGILSMHPIVSRSAVLVVTMDGVRTVGLPR